jgi:hypothetical protein
VTATPRSRTGRVVLFVVLGGMLLGSVAMNLRRMRAKRRTTHATAGVLSIRTAPPGAQVTIDGRVLPGRTPLMARGLKPGVPLTVDLHLPGYRAWRGTGRVHRDYGDGVLQVTLVPLAGPATRPASRPAPAAPVAP